MSELTLHPVAQIFPLMDEEELDQLAQDIQEHGLHEPIDLYEGMILDGRNRLLACGMVGIEVRTQEADLNGSTPLEYVISKNVHRRHLTTAQRAVLALEVLPLYEEQAAERRAAGIQKASDLRSGKIQKDLEIDSIVKRRYSGLKKSRARGHPAVRDAAQLVGIGESSVQRAKAIRQRNPEIIEQMRQGELNISEAERAVGYITSSFEPLESKGHDKSGKQIPRIYYGRGDKWNESSLPLFRYLKGWERRGFEFRHLNRREAAKRVRMIDELSALLSVAREDLARRTVKATTRVEG